MFAAPLAGIVCAAFVVLAAWHFKMAFSATPGTGAVPSVDGKPLFKPSKSSTVAVGMILLLFAALVAATAGFLRIGLPRDVLAWLCYALALGLFARAIGEFKYVGFFKRVRGSEFARMDTLLYSPLCLLMAAGVAAVGTLAKA